MVEAAGVEAISHFTSPVESVALTPLTHQKSVAEWRFAAKLRLFFNTSRVFCAFAKLVSRAELNYFVGKSVELKATEAPVPSGCRYKLAGSVAPRSRQRLGKFIR